MNEYAVKIIYILRVKDPTAVDVVVDETISAALAADMGFSITANLQTAKLFNEKYVLKLSEARHTDASEGGYNTDQTLGPTDQIQADEFINSRY